MTNELNVVVGEMEDLGFVDRDEPLPHATVNDQIAVHYNICDNTVNA